MGIILFLLVSIKGLNIGLYFLETKEKMQTTTPYCIPFKTVYSQNNSIITIWKLGKNRFV